MSTTATQAAAQLRKLADALDHATDTPIRAMVFLGDAGYGVAQAGRVATIDALARLLDMSAEPTKEGSYWRHVACDERDGVLVQISTAIDAPAQRCACGAECTHNAPGGAR